MSAAGAVIVTGASSGLGALMAEAFANAGREVVLVARRADRLEALAARLGRATPIALDLEAADAGARLEAALDAKGLIADVLVNNAGFGARGLHADLPHDRQLAMIDLNVRTLVDLTRRLLPAMVARGRGGILNVASTAAFQPGPHMAVYYATKAFVLSYTEALHEELRGTGVHVSALCPGPTQTEFGIVADMTQTPLFKLFAGKPEAVAAAGIAGLAANRAVVIPGALNWLLAQSTRLSPRLVTRRLAGMLQASRAVK